MSEQDIPHIFLLPAEARDALYTYLSQRPFREVHGLCSALRGLRRVNLTSISPPASEDGKSTETDQPGAGDEKPSTFPADVE